VYADQRRKRQQQQKRRGVRGPRHVMDTEPRDDVFAETQPNDVSPPDFRSEPVILDTLIIQDSANTAESDFAHGSMLDCISVSAPDDTVIKPSQLRESMRQRRTPRSSADDTAVTDRAPSICRAGSLRETRRTPAVEGETGFVRQKIAAIDMSSTPAASSDLRSPEVIAKSSPSVSAGPYTLSVPLSPEVVNKIQQSPDKHAKTSQQTGGGARSVSYEQLLLDYNQVRLLY